jgi:hypothetical protein
VYAGHLEPSKVERDRHVVQEDGNEDLAAQPLTRLADRGLGLRDQNRSAFDEAAVHGARLAIREPTLHPLEHGGRDARDILVGRGGRRVEHGRSADGKRVDAV